MASKRTYPRTQNLLILTQFLGDLIFSFVGLTLGYYLRFETPLRKLGVEDLEIHYIMYIPLLALGTVLLTVSFGYLKLYDGRLLLRPHRALNIILQGMFFWFLLFLSISLILKFEPSISRIFVLTSILSTLAIMLTWRSIFYRYLSRSHWRDRITQRIAIIGWNSEAHNLSDSIMHDKNHPYYIVGVITTHDSMNTSGRNMQVLGNIDNLEKIIQDNLLDIIIVANLDISREQLHTIATIAERLYVDFKVIPSFFQIFISNLRMQTVSGVPLLGVEEIPLKSVLNSFLKRMIDIFGALVGLIGSAPIVLVLAVIIKSESPGAVLYRQKRVCRHGQIFTIYKLRSMRLDAEIGKGAQWAVENDPRRLRIGAWMRKWNLDELPQFWNVLIGDMSLVGPRPERPELIQQFETEIPHYNPRHEVRPGITGWAQVNGLRGNTSLSERIRYDLYYIENWSLWFDLHILALTFIRRDNAY